MGEYAEMMLDGEACASCGEYLGGGEGFPRTCASCSRSDLTPSTKNAFCPLCGKGFKSDYGRNEHVKGKHALVLTLAPYVPVRRQAASEAGVAPDSTGPLSPKEETNV